MTHHSVTEVLEKLYLEAAPPAHVYDWLRDHKHESPSDETVRSLLARGDRFIDLALAQFCSSEQLLRDIYRRGDRGLQCAVLSNHRHALWERRFSTFGITIFETDEELDSFLRDAPSELLTALFMNPGLSEYDLESVFKREGRFKNLPDERWYLIVLTSLYNPRLHDEAEAEAPIEFLGQRSNYSAQIASWTAFLTLPADDACAYALNEPTRTLIFSGVSLPTDRLTKANAGDGQGYVEALREAHKESEREFLRKVFERWSPPAEAESVHAENFNSLREWISSRVALDASYRDFLGGYPDVYVRRGLYRSFQPREEKELNEALEKDDKEFVDAAIENPWFSRRNAPLEVRRRMYEIADATKWRDEYDDPCGHRFRERSESLGKADPTIYEDWFVSIGPPEPSGRISISTLLNRLLPESAAQKQLGIELDRVLESLHKTEEAVTRTAEGSAPLGARIAAVEQSMAHARWLLWILVAAVAYMILR